MTAWLENFCFGHRRLWLVLWVLITLAAGYAASHLKIDASFEKQVPLQHPYIQTLLKYEAFVTGANRITVAVRAKQGDIYNPEFLETLKKVNDEVFFISGVNRNTLRSIWTPNVRYTESVEGGLESQAIIPQSYTPTPAGVDMVRRNVLRGDLIGSLVSRDGTAAMVVGELRNKDFQTGLPINYVDVAEKLNDIRQRYDSDKVQVHIIGYAPLVGAIVEGAQAVLLFFAISVVLTLLLVRWYTESWKMSLLLLSTSVTTVIWQLGITGASGVGMNPLSAIVPFLIFAISVSHGIQVVNMQMEGLAQGMTPLDAARNAFRSLFEPGISALAANVIGFGTLLFIPIGVIRDIALMASVGVAVVSICKLTVLPVLLTYVKATSDKPKVGNALTRSEWLWNALAKTTELPVATALVVGSIVLGIAAALVGQHRVVGDTHAGASELYPNSVYNRDIEAIVSRFDLSSDVLVVVAAAAQDSCFEYAPLRRMDRLSAELTHTEGVRAVVSLASVIKNINAALHEGNPKHIALQKGPGLISLAADNVPAASGLRNLDCTVMPIYIFAADHKAQTITRLLDTVKAFSAKNPGMPSFELAAGPLGVDGAVNETVVDTEPKMLMWVYIAVSIVTFLGLRRSWQATLCVILPLVLVTLLADAMMAVLDIGLRVATLPVTALGVGIGVDYGVYTFSRFLHLRQDDGLTFHDAYGTALRETGRAVIITGLTLSVSVATWAFSPLRYQADLGIMLTVMFMFSMFGAILVSPALARFFFWRDANASSPASEKSKA